MMLKRNTISVLLVLAILFLLLSGCSGSDKETSTDSTASAAQTSTGEKVELLVSAAASLKDAAKEVADKYTAINPNVKITCTFGASGALQTQIEEGAPADIFISASKKSVTALQEKGLLVDKTIKDLVGNKLVLIVPKDSKKNIKGFEDAATDTVSNIALGEPKAVPAGQYTEEVFTNLKLLDSVKKKATYGSDVKQVLSWVESEEVDCGVVYSTDALISEKVKVICEAPKDSHKAIVYPVAVIKNSNNLKDALLFYEYLCSKDSGEVFEKYGFTVN